MAKSVGKVKKSAQKMKAVSKITHPRGVRRRGGYISQKSERGKGIKFNVETFATVSSFKPGTRIKYGPNPKQPQSKSFKRYAGYQHAKTVGEALACGSKRADLMWELERGDYKIVGGERSEKAEIAAIGQKKFDEAVKVLAASTGPIGCPVKFTDPQAVERCAREEEWRKTRMKLVEQKAKEMRLKVETTKEIEESGESADQRLQRRVAEALANERLATGKKIVDKDVIDLLHCWGFGENSMRLNVMPEGQKYVYSDTLGAIRTRWEGLHPTPLTVKYPSVPKLFCKWLADNNPVKGSKFLCTAINLNANYAGKRHRDQGNEGPSVIKAFGKFKGGRLHYFKRDTQKPRPKLETLDKKNAETLDISKKAAIFDGNRAHEVEAFTGERYSVVFFTAKGYAKGKPKDVEFLKTKCGFPWPTTQGMSALKKATLK